MPTRMTTPEIQSKDICCGLTPSWKGGRGRGKGGKGGRKGGKGGRKEGKGGRSKKTPQDQFYFLFSFCLGIITIINTREK